MVHVIEGSWDEVKQHEAEFAGRHLRVVVEPDHESGRASEIECRIRAWNEFVADGVSGVIVDDSREGIYGNELDRG